MKNNVVLGRTIFVFSLLVSFSSLNGEKYVKINIPKSMSVGFYNATPKNELQFRNLKRDELSALREPSLMIAYIAATIEGGYAYPEAYTAGINQEIVWEVNTNFWKNQDVRTAWDWVNKSVETGGMIVSAVSLIYGAISKDTTGNSQIVAGAGISLAALMKGIDVIFPSLEKNKIKEKTSRIISDLTRSRIAFDMTTERKKKISEKLEQFQKSANEVSKYRLKYEKYYNEVLNNDQALLKEKNIITYCSEFQTDIQTLLSMNDDLINSNNEFFILVDDFINDCNLLDSTSPPIDDDKRTMLATIKTNAEDIKIRYVNYFPSIAQDSVYLKSITDNLSAKLKEVSISTDTSTDTTQ